MSEKKDIHCRDVGCTLKGYWIEVRPDGEALIRTKAFHEGKRHVAEFNLAEKTVELIKRDARFAAHFENLLKAE
jgi:hypothetical protein